MSVIDRKFIIKAVNPVNGNQYTEQDSILLCAKDAAVPAALEAYRDKCIELKANQEHIVSIEMLIDRVNSYQQNNGCRTPDTVGKEIDRCIIGNLSAGEKTSFQD